MRHRVDGRKFDRSGSQRLAMFRNLVASLILHEKIVTTDAKAKELRRLAERLVTRAKRVGTAAGKSKMTKQQRIDKLSAYRDIRRWLPMEAFDKEGLSVSLAGKLIDELAPRYATRHGGYTRIFKIGSRRGDNAPLSAIEFLPASQKAEKAEEDKKKKKKPRKSVFASKSKKETVEK